MKMFPLPRENELFRTTGDPEAASIRSGGLVPFFASSFFAFCPSFASSLAGSGFGGSGGGYISFHFSSNAGPSRSVKMASAFAGSVTTSNRPVRVSQFARY